MTAVSHRTILGVALALLLAIMGGALLSRELLHSDAAPARASAGQILVLMNQQRASRGLAALQLDPKLAQAAAAHSQDMARHGYFAHDDPTSRWDDRVRRYVTKRQVGEILAFGSGAYATPQGLINTWMNSPEHRRIILTPDLRLVGFGLQTGPFQGTDNVTLATADFSTAT